MEKPIEVMRIVRRPPLGKLIVENNGRQYETLSEINNPKVSQMVLAAIGELVSFAGGYHALVAAGFAPDLAHKLADGTSGSSSLEDQQAAFLAQLQQKSPTATTPTNSAAPTSLFRRRRANSGSPEPTHLDLVSALDDLFQKQLTRMPELGSQHVRVETNLRGGTRINVNGRYYEEPGEIPNPMIRLAYKMAVREWEASSDGSASIIA